MIIVLILYLRKGTFIWTKGGNIDCSLYIGENRNKIRQDPFAWAVERESWLRILETVLERQKRWRGGDKMESIREKGKSEPQNPGSLRYWGFPWYINNIYGAFALSTTVPCVCFSWVLSSLYRHFGGWEFTNINLNDKLEAPTVLILSGYTDLWLITTGGRWLRMWAETSEMRRGQTSYLPVPCWQ